jgi:hypothetical protein
MRLHPEERRIIRHAELELQLPCAVDERVAPRRIHRKIREWQRKIRGFLQADLQRELSRPRVGCNSGTPTFSAWTCASE